MGKKKVFLSHISEETATAAVLKKALVRDFLGLLRVFVSSDGASIAAGEPWLTCIEKALRESSMLITLCSPASIRRPWINFEAGAAWMRQIPVIPACHAGLTPGDLPLPLSLHQGLALCDPEGLGRLYARISSVLSCKTPKAQLDTLARDLSQRSAAIVGLPATEEMQLKRDRSIRESLQRALKHPRFKWRSLKRVAAEVGVSEEVAASLLRGNTEARFSRGKSGNQIVALRSRLA